MAEARWTSLARRELLDIAYHVATLGQRPDAAHKVIDDVERKCAEYAEQPLMGSPAGDLGENMRTFTHKRWVIIYVPTDYGLDVISVVNGARDYPKRFGGE